MPTFTDVLFTRTGGSSQVEVSVGKWVRIVNNATAVAYVSAAASDVNGQFSVTNPPAGTYTVYTGPTAAGPWTVTGEVTYIVPLLSPTDIFTVSARTANFEMAGALTGSGSFDGGTGSFNGSASGTIAGINAASTFAGRLLDIQINGQSRARAEGIGGAAWSIQPRPTGAGGDLGLLVNAATDPSTLTAVTTSLRVKGGTQTYITAANSRNVQFDPATYAATTPQTFSQVETVLVNGAPVLGTNATFTQSVGLKVVGGIVSDGTGSTGSVGDPIALSVGSGFIVFNPQISSPYGGDAGVGIGPQDGTGIDHSTRSFAVKANTIYPSVSYDQQMSALFQAQTISGAYVMDSAATVWIENAPHFAGGMVYTKPWALRINHGDLGMTDRIVFDGATAAKIVGGSVSQSLRNYLDTADNLLITDAGLVTARAGLVATAGGVTATAGNVTATAGDVAVTAGNLTFGAASARIIPGATSLLFRDTANANTNVTITDAGKVTTRSDLTFGGALMTSLTGAPTITNLNAGISSVTVTGSDAGGFFDVATNGSAPTANQRLFTATYASGTRYSVTPIFRVFNGSQGANAAGALGTASWVGVPGSQVASATAVDVYANNGAMPNNATLRLPFAVTGRG